ncbi:reverse transcriptase domain-containing protein [Tanacetum coccineum]
MPTPPPSPLISLSPPSAGERLARCTASSAHSSPPPVPSPLLLSSGCLTQIQTLMIASTQALVDADTAALPSPPLPPLPPSLYVPPHVDRRDDILESELPPRKRPCLFSLGPRYEVGESCTARPTGGRGIDYGFVSTITSTLRYKDVPETSIKLLLFPFSIDGPAWIWLDKEPPRSIVTWDDLVSKFINHFFPPSKTTNLRNEISNFQQKFEEMFYKAWDRFKDLLRACPHHGFTELHQLDSFYNGLNPSDQDSLNSAAGGNLLERSAQDVLKIIENKSKVRHSRNKPIVSQVKASNVDSSEMAKLTDAVIK